MIAAIILICLSLLKFGVSCYNADKGSDIIYSFAALCIIFILYYFAGVFNNF